MTQLDEIHLTEISRDELRRLDVPEALVVYIPLPSFGRTNSLLDICDDLICASWTAEQLGRCAQSVTFDEDYVKESYQTRVKLTLSGVDPGIRAALLNCQLALSDREDFTPAEDVLRGELHQALNNYRDTLESLTPVVPDILDWYYVNFVSGAIHELESDSPDYFADLVQKHPEYRFGFFRSAQSSSIGAPSYASRLSWAVPESVEPDHFFKIMSERYRASDFSIGHVVMVRGQSYVLISGDALYFPMNQYFKSRVCTSIVPRESDDWLSDRFDWINASFTYSPDREDLLTHMPEAFRVAPVRNEACFVHRSGSLIYVEDGAYRHYLYDTRFLDQSELRILNERVSDLAHSVASSLGIAPAFTIDWSRLSDDDFECLCYDIIYADPKFDSDTIRKMGKSRSRDGGRDIVVTEVRRHHGVPPKKWIFQCKLITDGSSLTGKRLTDVGDMLDVYQAQGFGVMTSAVIDATLYDKLDGVCQKRNIIQQHSSLLELERRLARNPTIRSRYFPQL